MWLKLYERATCIFSGHLKHSFKYITPLKSLKHTDLVRNILRIDLFVLGVTLLCGFVLVRVLAVVTGNSLAAILRQHFL